jgi:selenocysteine lyase/cysteine desulfurase
MQANESTSKRRQFLKSSALLFGAAAVNLRGHAQSGSDHGAAPINRSDYWDQVRAQFTFFEGAVPMNAANLCPAFRAVTDAVTNLTEDIDLDCSFNNRAKFGVLLEQARALVAAQLNVSSDEVALVRNTSEANNIINNGLALEPGDEVLLWEQNHPTNNVAWEVRAARFGTRIRKVTTPVAPADPQQLVDAFVREMTPNTRVLAITHVSNVSGVRLPVAELVAAAHSRGIYVHVDGAQTWGAMALDLQQLGVDSFTASAHKWYMGPKEVGLLYVREDNIPRIWPSVIAPGWGDDIEADPVGARKFESLGQRDDAALAALALTAQLHDQIGPARIEARVAELSSALKQGVLDAGLTLVTPADPQLSHGVCITQVPGNARGSLANRLYTEYGIAGAATGGLRLCPTIYNTHGHVERAVTALREMLA